MNAMTLPYLFLFFLTYYRKAIYIYFFFTCVLLSSLEHNVNALFHESFSSCTFSTDFIYMTWCCDDRSQISASVCTVQYIISSPLLQHQHFTKTNLLKYINDIIIITHVPRAGVLQWWWMCSQILPAHGDQISPLYGSDTRCRFFTSPVEPDV